MRLLSACPLTKCAWNITDQKILYKNKTVLIPIQALLKPLTFPSSPVLSQVASYLGFLVIALGNLIAGNINKADFSLQIFCFFVKNLQELKKFRAVTEQHPHKIHLEELLQAVSMTCTTQYILGLCLNSFCVKYLSFCRNTVTFSSLLMFSISCSHCCTSLDLFGMETLITNSKVNNLDWFYCTLQSLY